MGVVLRVCEQDLDATLRPLPNYAPIRVLGERRFGGCVDTLTKRLIGPSRSPVIWYAGAEQSALVTAGDSVHPKTLVFGGEGAGKTRVLAMWLVLTAISYTGHSGFIGCTAPSTKRMLAVLSEMRAICPPEWYDWRKSESMFALTNGITILPVSTHRYSEEQGSPLQSYTFLACGSDELQDSTDADDDVETRGRGAPGGVYRRFATSTNKQASKWKTLKQKIRKAGLWREAKLPGPSNPFVFPRHWENLRHTLSDREFRRRVLAEELSPEKTLYPTWRREANCIPLPPRAKDVTARILRRYGRNVHMLIGYDPGKLMDVAVLLRAYEWPGRRRHAWFAIAEFVLKSCTTAQFGFALRAHLRAEYDLMEPGGGLEVAVDADVPQILADPANEANDDKPDEQVYKAMKRLGFQIKPAAWSKTNRLKHGRVPRESRIETMCNLFCTAAGEHNFYVLEDGRGRPCCPGLVDSIESQERDELGRAEMVKKNQYDKTHHATAVGYAMWPLEKTTLRS